MGSPFFSRTTSGRPSGRRTGTITGLPAASITTDPPTSCFWTSWTLGWTGCTFHPRASPMAAVATTSAAKTAKSTAGSGILLPSHSMKSRMRWPVRPVVGVSLMVVSTERGGRGIRRGGRPGGKKATIDRILDLPGRNQRDPRWRRGHGGAGTPQVRSRGRPVRWDSPSHGARGVGSRRADRGHPGRDGQSRSAMPPPPRGVSMRMRAAVAPLVEQGGGAVVPSALRRRGLPVRGSCRRRRGGSRWGGRAEWARASGGSWVSRSRRASTLAGLFAALGTRLAASGSGRMGRAS
jgi:hypothetical protein